MRAALNRLGWSLGLGALLLATALGAGCDRWADWRDRQVERSNMLAKGDKVDAPEKPIEVSGDLYDELPIQPEWTVVEYAELDGGYDLKVLAGADAGATAQWLIEGFAAKGYSSEDNVSRILEGVHFRRPGAQFPLVYCALELNLSDQVMVVYRARKKDQPTALTD